MAKSISRIVEIDKERNCLRLKNEEVFYNLQNLENEVIGKLPNCWVYKVTYTQNPKGKFIGIDRGIKKVSSVLYRCCCFMPNSWNGIRFNRDVKILK